MLFSSLILSVEAICDGLLAGDQILKVRIMECTGLGHDVAEPRTYSGWHDGIRMHIEEVRTDQRLDAGDRKLEQLVIDVSGF